jgi:hypothetical protein
VVEKSAVPVTGIAVTAEWRRQDPPDDERMRRLEAVEEFAAGLADQTSEQIGREAARALAEVRAERDMRPP